MLYSDSILRLMEKPKRKQNHFICGKDRKIIDSKMLRLVSVWENNMNIILTSDLGHKASSLKKIKFFLSGFTEISNGGTEYF